MQPRRLELIIWLLIVLHKFRLQPYFRLQENLGGIPLVQGIRALLAEDRMLVPARLSEKQCVEECLRWRRVRLKRGI